MLRTTLGQILVNDALPEDLRDYGRTLDKKGMNDLFRQIAQQHPDKYAAVTKRLNDVGRRVASEFGGYSFGLQHLKKSEASKVIQTKLRGELKTILDDDSLTDKQRNERIVMATHAVQQKQIDAVYDEAVKANNPLAMQVVSGSRGNKMNLASLLGSDMLYSDHRDEVIPLPVLNSYSQGLKPIEYWSGVYGARRGTMATKFATADAGFLSKQLNQVAHRLMVVDEDDPREDLPNRGLPVDVDDPDNEGSLLAKDIGPYKRNTVLTPKMLKHLRSVGHERILVRSPAVGGSPDGGVYSRDVGIREYGTLPGRGSQVGLTAVQALSEPLSQGQLCLAYGTPLRMADGSDRLLEDIRVGDQITGCDPVTGLYDEQQIPVTVTAVHENGWKLCCRYVFHRNDNDEFAEYVGEIVCTPDHKVLGCDSQNRDLRDFESAEERYKVKPRPIGWHHRGGLNLRDHVSDKFHARYFPLATSTEASDAALVGQYKLGMRQTRDLTVDHPAHLYVLANGLVVSNSAKHSGGVAGQEKAVGGFAYINQLIQTPKKFKGGAAHATVDGRVGGIEDAPAGGKYVWVGGQRHYVANGFDLKIGKGDEVEAGDVISEGLPNPATIVEHKGIGEGRRYFIGAFSRAMKDAGMKVNRRNVELLSRGLINHVRLTDELGDHVPDDVVPYSSIEHAFTPRDDHENLRVDRSVGRYLERPVLHYSVGTKIRPSVVKDLQRFGIEEVATHRDPPPFQPEMIRGMFSLQHDPDWMTRMYGSGLKSSLLDAVHHGATSDEAGTSFVPGLSRAVDFGRVGQVRQPEPGIKPPPEGQPFGDLDMGKKTPGPLAIKMPTAPAPPPKKPGMFSGLFKLSSDLDLAREAQALLNKYQVKTAVGANNQSAPGSSTVGTDGSSAPKAPAATPGSAPPPTPPQTSQAPPPPQPPKPAQPPAPGGHAAPPQPYRGTNPGQVDPGRQAALGNEGFTPGGGMFQNGDDPEMFADFVAGGGSREQPESGAGGMLGAAVRFGSGLDTSAMGTLTSGSNYAKNNYGYGSGQTGLDALYGGTPSPSASLTGSVPATEQQTASQGAPSPEQQPGAVDIAKTLTNPATNAATAAGGSLLYRGVRSMIGKPAAGGLLGGLKKPAGKIVPGLGTALEVREGVNMTPEEARAQYQQKLDSVKGWSDMPGYLLDNAVNMGRNGRAVVTGIGDAIDERGEASAGKYRADVNEATLLHKRLQDPATDPHTKAQAEARLNELRSANSNSLLERGVKAFRPGIVGSGDRFEQEAAIGLREQKIKQQAAVEAKRQQELRDSWKTMQPQETRQNTPEEERLWGWQTRFKGMTGTTLLEGARKEREQLVRLAAERPELAEQAVNQLHDMRGWLRDDTSGQFDPKAADAEFKDSIRKIAGAGTAVMSKGGSYAFPALKPPPGGIGLANRTISLI